MDPGIVAWVLGFQGESWDSSADPRISGVDARIPVWILGYQWKFLVSSVDLWILV